MFVTVEGSRSLSGTFFWEIITAACLDLRPRVVTPDELMALKAYSLRKKLVVFLKSRGYVCIPTW
jgi:hypothetical protein